jgi:hypothetical protein
VYGCKSRGWSNRKKVTSNMYRPHPLRSPHARQLETRSSLSSAWRTDARAVPSFHLIAEHKRELWSAA